MTIKEEIKTVAPLSLHKRTVLNIFSTHNFLKEKLIETLSPYDLSLEQFNVLRILKGQRGKPVNMSLIQERMVSKSSNTTRLIDKLLVKQYVTRCVCDMNRRKMDVAITAVGLEILNELDPRIENIEQKMTNVLDEKELEQLNILLEKMRSYNMKEDCINLKKQRDETKIEELI